MDLAYDVGAGDVEDLVAPVQAVEVVERQVVLLQHRAHRSVRHDDSLRERSTKRLGLCGHKSLLGAATSGRAANDTGLSESWTAISRTARFGVLHTSVAPALASLAPVRRTLDR